MLIHESRTVTLHNGVVMPRVGLGTWDQGADIITAVKTAADAGYRSIDTGSFYQNEDYLGQAISQSGLPRNDFFITTKVWNSEHGYDATLHSFDVSLKKLAVSYVDLFLIHWPIKGKSAETWRTLETVYKQGRARAIGVSNFEEAHLDALMGTATIIPMVNQIELHPLKSSVKLRQYCKNHAIQVEAWSPLAQGKLFDNAVLKEIAVQYGRSVSQIVLRWHLQNDVVVIPKSQNPKRITENITLFDFKLDDATVAKIDALDEDLRLLGFMPDDLPDSLRVPPVSPWSYSL